LGTVPDFAPVDFGVRLSGVRAGSPAEQAGMQKGDVLIRFDGEEIEDLYVFTDALRSHATGDTVEVVVLREGEEVPLVAVLGNRGERE
ncbi:MAG: PDZ domain-containing protein, partial [Gemmatimonadota bacterium]